MPHAPFSETVAVAVGPLELSATGTTLKCSCEPLETQVKMFFLKQSFNKYNFNVRLDKVIDPVLSDEHWLNPRT
jgi:hypothetical protein